MLDAWLPTLRNPEDLYLAYFGQTEKLTTASKIAALTDLRSLPIIPNLSQKNIQRLCRHSITPEANYSKK